MIFTSAQIEAITQDVLRELKSRGVAIDARVSAGSSAQEASVPSMGQSQKSGHPDVLQLNQKVITEDSLSAVERSGRRISVPAGAVVTPSGRDYIRRHQLQLVNASSPASDSGASGTLVRVDRCSAADSAAASSQWSVVKAGCDFDAAYQTRKLTAGPVVTCSRQPSVVACLLNRDATLRAAVVESVASVTALQEAMNPQVLCVNSQGWSFADFRRLFRELQNTASDSPAEWKELR